MTIKKSNKLPFYKVAIYELNSNEKINIIAGSFNTNPTLTTINVISGVSAGTGYTSELCNTKTTNNSKI